MNKIKALLLSAAVVFAIGGAFATSSKTNECEDPLLPKYDAEMGGTQITGNGTCEPDDFVDFCYYVEVSPGNRVPCHEKSIWTPEP